MSSVNNFGKKAFKKGDNLKEQSGASAPEKVNDKELMPGDLIEIDRGLYQHWAIYSENGDVVHVAPTSEHADAGLSRLKSVLHNKATVKKEKLQDVAGSDEYRTHNLRDEQHERRPTQDIVQDAESHVGKTLPYGLFTNNCEHFVTLLRYGKPQSLQVQKAVAIIAAVVAAVCVFICLVLYCKRQSKVYSVLGFLSLFLYLGIVFFLVIQRSNHQ